LSDESHVNESTIKQVTQAIRTTLTPQPKSAAEVRRLIRRLTRPAFYYKSVEIKATFSDHASLTDELNEYAEEGWEIVSIGYAETHFSAAESQTWRTQETTVHPESVQWPDTLILRQPYESAMTLQGMYDRAEEEGRDA